ncbi:peptidase, partial [Burkholderia multivorans]
ADRLVQQLKLDGVLQIASFHPQYRFDGSEPDDIENYTNRAPYPILHLLREDSIARAVDAFPDAAAIYEKNQET